MGHLCCLPEHKIQIYPQQKPQATHLLNQASLQVHNGNFLSSLVSYMTIKINKKKMQQNKFTHMIILSEIKVDKIAEYFKVKLIDQKFNIQYCTLKKISRHKMNAIQIKNQLIIQFLICSSFDHQHFTQIIYHYQDLENIYIFYSYFQNQMPNPYLQTCNTFSPYTPFQTNFQTNLKISLVYILRALQQLHQIGLAYCAIDQAGISSNLHGYPVLSSFQRITPFGKKCINKRNNPYCSPEEINNEKIEASSDLWSVGILIYYLIGGKYPSHSFLYDKQISIELEFSVFVSTQLNDLIHKLLEKDRSKRPLKTIKDITSHSFFVSFDFQYLDKLEQTDRLVKQQQEKDLSLNVYEIKANLQISEIFHPPAIDFLSSFYNIEEASEIQIDTKNKSFEAFQQEQKDDLSSNDELINDQFQHADTLIIDSFEHEDNSDNDD